MAASVCLYKERGRAEQSEAERSKAEQKKNKTRQDKTRQETAISSSGTYLQIQGQCLTLLSLSTASLR